MGKRSRAKHGGTTARLPAARTMLTRANGPGRALGPSCIPTVRALRRMPVLSQDICLHTSALGK
jgi:hypothetical protein